MMLAHASDCRLAQPSLNSSRPGQARLCKCLADAGCAHTRLRAVRKQRSSGCSRRQKTAVLASSVPQDVIDVEGTLVDDRIPVTIITGFLGSGKTTLLNALLKQEHGRRIAVIENEFGEIDIDSELVAHQDFLEDDQQIMMLNNGCLCCTVKDDLIRMLGELVERRATFDHVVIETTGLADPAPIIQTFRSIQYVAQNYALDGVLTLVDAKHIGQHLDERKPEGVVNEALSQVAYADRIILNKTDLVSGDELMDTEMRLKNINALAQVVKAQRADVKADYVLGIGGFDLDRVAEEVIGEAEVSQSHSHSQDHDHSHDHGHTHDHEEEHAHAHTHNREEHSHSPGAAHVHDHSSEHSHGPEDGHGHAHGHADHHHHDHTHDDSVGSVSLELEGFLDLDKVNDWMENLLYDDADDLYRFKGVLAIEDWPDRFIFQGVHQVFEGSPGKPWKEGEAHKSKMVFIGKDLDRDALAAGLKGCLA